jgi:nicotinamide-nucleotide amidase
MKAIILSIGDELIIGQTVDTNAAWLSEELMKRGVQVVEHITVGDLHENMVKALRQGCDAADIVMVTGGLGPTDDDITRQALAEVMEVGLELHEPSLNHIEAIFQRSNRDMPERNRIQAMIPTGCEAIPNPIGTAAGIYALVNRTLLFFMPGVPKEMRLMAAESIFPRIAEVLSDSGGDRQVIKSKKLRLFGISESSLADVLGTLMKRDLNPLVNCTVSTGIITLNIIARAVDNTAADMLIAPVEEDIRQKVGNKLFGTDLETLAQAVGAMLRASSKSLAVAESCTGGLLAKELTDQPGSSEFFLGGWVCYSNQAKIEFLGVKPAWFEIEGAVSEPVARELAENARSRAGSDFALGITGLAGPSGGTDSKPVGLVYIGLSTAGETVVKKFVFNGDREMIRHLAVSNALDMLRQNVSLYS